jgi:DNA-binding PadR family transcriptional regulator
VLELAVLGLLKEQPLHGYELKKRLGETLGFLWGVSYGSLYPALRRLEREGAIESVQPAPGLTSAPVPTGSITGDLAGARRRAGTRRTEGSRRTRKAYRVTEKGEALLVDLLLADDDRADDDKGFALKLAFCRHAPADARLRFLERRREALRERSDRVPRAGTRHERPARSQDRYLTSLLEHRARATARDLEWVEELIAAERGPEPEFLGQEGATA